MSSLRYIGKDPESGDHGCPSVWVDEESRDFLIQGWRLDETTTEHCQRDGDIPEHETIVRIPHRMLPVIREAIRVAESDSVR